MVHETKQSHTYDTEWENARAALTLASAETRRRQHEAKERADIEAACAAAYRAGRIDEAKWHLDASDPKQMRAIVAQWCSPDSDASDG
jgi:hypothetical protein